MGMLLKDFKEILTTQFISITGGLVAGSLLAFSLDKIYIIPGFFILLPGMLNMRGSISGSLAARLSAGLHLGLIKPGVITNRITLGNIKSVLMLSVIISSLIGILAYLVNYSLFGINFPKIILMSLFAGVVSNIIEVPMTVFLTFWLFKRGFDPDNMMGPYVSASGDIVIVLSLLIAVMII